MSQSQLAMAAGTSQPTIAEYESGRKSPTLRTLQKIAAASGLELIASFVPLMSREDKRSLFFHRAIAEKLEENPDPIINRARNNLARLCKLHLDATGLLQEWDRWLALSVTELIPKICDPGMQAREMRQVSPFSGILGAQERATILKAFRKELQDDA